MDDRDIVDIRCYTAAVRSTEKYIDKLHVAFNNGGEMPLQDYIANEVARQVELALKNIVT
jgi:hypothetical protein